MSALRILLIGPASVERVGGTTVSFGHLRRELEQTPDVRLQVVSSMGIRGGGALAPVRLLWFYGRILRELVRVDVVSVHAMPSGLPYFAWFVVLACRISGKPLVYRSFGGMYYDEIRPGLRGLASVMFRHADAVLLQTREMLERGKADRIRRLEWFPTARPMPEEVYRKSGPCRRFVFVGQLKVRKGLVVLTNVSEQLPEDAIVDVYGPWYDLPRDTFVGRSRIRYQRELAPCEVHEVLKGYDALVFPSILVEEGHAGIIPEAYAAGIPVIATRWRALPEIVDDGVSGLLVDPQDEQSLYLAMMRLYSDQGLYCRLVEGTSAMRERFSTKAQAAHFLRVCRDLVRQP